MARRVRYAIAVSLGKKIAPLCSAMAGAQRGKV